MLEINNAVNSFKIQADYQCGQHSERKLASTQEMLY